MGSLRPNFGRSNDGDSKKKGIDEKIVIPIDLSNDPDYLELIRLFQNGDFVGCREILDKLEERYPDHPVLLSFDENLQMKLMFRTMEDTNKKVQNREKVKSSFNFVIFTIIAVLIVDRKSVV